MGQGRRVVGDEFNLNNLEENSISPVVLLQFRFHPLISSRKFLKKTAGEGKKAAEFPHGLEDGGVNRGKERE